MTMIVVGDYTTFVIINVGEGVYYDIDGETQNVIVDSITGTSTVISVSSETQSITLKEGDLKTLDANDDGSDDYIITCKTINSAQQTVEFSFSLASNESEKGIPGFGPLMIIFGGFLANGFWVFSRKFNQPLS